MLEQFPHLETANSLLLEREPPSRKHHFTANAFEWSLTYLSIDCCGVCELAHFKWHHVRQGRIFAQRESEPESDTITWDRFHPDAATHKIDSVSAESQIQLKPIFAIKPIADHGPAIERGEGFMPNAASSGNDLHREMAITLFLRRQPDRRL